MIEEDCADKSRSSASLSSRINVIQLKLVNENLDNQGKRDRKEKVMMEAKTSPLATTVPSGISYARDSPRLDLIARLNSITVRLLRRTR
jgi:hypothetical protein